MKGLVNFLKTTIVGGIIFLIPVILVVIVFGKALALIQRISKPIANFFPIDSIAEIAVADIIGFLLLAFVCFLAGLLARTSLASKAVQQAEAKFLWHLPGYAFTKGITDSLSTTDETSALQPVSCRLDDSWQIGFEVERMLDGRVIVYLPGAPDPWSGSILVIDADRVETLDATMITTIGCLRKLGHGAGQLLKTKS